MTKVVLLFLTTGAALMVAVALIVGIAWVLVAIPVMIIAGTGYGVIALNRRWHGLGRREMGADPVRPEGGATR
jgi:F0F1-type ATP synthase membrane subunit c/vacuolar-type H+-ATPase subunit K